jgi:hypothetical protein
MCSRFGIAFLVAIAIIYMLRVRSWLRTHIIDDVSYLSLSGIVFGHWLLGAYLQLGMKLHKAGDSWAAKLLVFYEDQQWRPFG